MDCWNGYIVFVHKVHFSHCVTHTFPSSCRNGLLESLTASTEVLQSFWAKQNKLGLLDSPYWRSFNWQEELPIPWAVHGDGAPYSEIDSLRVISMRCMLSDVSAQHSQLLLASVPKYLACEINHLAFLLLDEGWIAYIGLDSISIYSPSAG